MSQTHVVRTCSARAPKRREEEIYVHVVYLDRFLCALLECWQYQSECSKYRLINIDNT